MIAKMSSVEWNNNMALRLIREFRRHEVLWNINHDFYFRSNKKEEAWGRISQRLGVTKVDAKRKLESLRGSYRREKCRIKTRVMRGQSPRSRWFAFDSMKFLDLNQGLKEKTKGRIVEIKEEVMDDDIACVLSADSSGDASEFFGLLAAQANNTVEPQHQLRKPKEDGSMKYEDVYSLVKSCISKDECAIYADYVATVLRKLDDHPRTLIQHKINTLLFDALTQNQAILMAQQYSSNASLDRS